MKYEIEEMNAQEIVDLWFDFCEEMKWYEDIIYQNDEFFFESYQGIDIAQKVAHGEWRYSDDYVKLDGNGNFVSFTYTSEVLENIDKDQFIMWLLEKKGVEQ
jgi:hypothetical protein